MPALKVVTIGAGAAGKHHAVALHAVGADLIGVSDIDEGQSTILATAFSTQAMEVSKLLRAGIDLMVVGTPPTSHAVVTSSLEPGTGVVVEKSIAVSVADYCEMIAATDKCGLHTAAMYQHRLALTEG